MKVVDASVVVGWLLAGQASAGSRALLEEHVSGKHPLVAPELLQYEVCNALTVRGRLTVAMARQAYDYFDSLEIETYSLGVPEYDRTIALAAEHGVSAYDASYAALAQTLGCRMVTADRKLATAIKSLGLTDMV